MKIPFIKFLPAFMFFVAVAFAQTSSAQESQAQKTVDQESGDSAASDDESNNTNSAADDSIQGVRRGLTPPNPFPRTTKLKPDVFDLGAGWLNADAPISLADLKGKIVILDFWTYCCINCMHVLPDLKYLEQKYGDQLVVIGIHSAKFENEKDSQQIQDAILRYEIDHPVINDREMALWDRFGIRSWPTLALIDPEGRLVGVQPGEGNRILFDRILDQMVKYHRWKGTLNEEPLRFQKSAADPDLTVLHYPGKVLVDEPSKRIFVADSSHHRIVVCDLDGKFETTIGSANQGFGDGDFQSAEFNRPQGMTLIDNKLFVADTDNHAIRIVDLDAKMVTTLVGNGVQAGFGATGGSLSKAKLNSPWDLVVSSDQMYIAMAGSHQIWAHQLGSNQISVFAGNGAEDIVNGSRQAAAFAQPSDLSVSSDGNRLYVADSEGSAIRRIDFDTGFVSTVAGASGLPRGQSLFEFGDVDGAGPDIRLQHPLAVTVVQSGLLVADSYNHKIKSVAIPSLQASTWLGSGKADSTVNPVALAEPGDITVTEDFAYIADTNNHRILKVNLKTQAAIQLLIEVPSGEPDPTETKEQSDVDSESQSETNQEDQVKTEL
ncbi:MAG: thioredoxin-like domain-containing protein [Fuerstiella sp.]